MRNRALIEKDGGRARRIVGVKRMHWYLEGVRMRERRGEESMPDMNDIDDMRGIFGQDRLDEAYSEFTRTLRIFFERVYVEWENEWGRWILNPCHDCQYQGPDCPCKDGSIAFTEAILEEIQKWRTQSKQEVMDRWIQEDLPMLMEEWADRWREYGK